MKLIEKQENLENLAKVKNKFGYKYEKVYSTSDYYTPERRETTVEWIPSQSSRFMRPNKNDPFYEGVLTCKRLWTYSEALKKPGLSHIANGKFIYNKNKNNNDKH